jgi:hypothetical protein
VWIVAPGVSTSTSRRAAQAGMCLNEGFFWMRRYIRSGRLGLRLTQGTVVPERAWTRGMQGQPLAAQACTGRLPALTRSRT